MNFLNIFVFNFNNQKLNIMTNLFLSVPVMATDDYVGLTFFVGCMAMMAASAFFFLASTLGFPKFREPFFGSSSSRYQAVGSR